MAVIERRPGIRLEVVSVAVPELREPVPSDVVPSLNVTVPVGTPTDALTVAVNVTESPTAEGLGEDESRVIVAPSRGS